MSGILFEQSKTALEGLLADPSVNSRVKARVKASHESLTAELAVQKKTEEAEKAEEPEAVPVDAEAEKAPAQDSPKATDDKEQASPKPDGAPAAPTEAGKPSPVQGEDTKKGIAPAAPTPAPAAGP